MKKVVIANLKAKYDKFEELKVYLKKKIPEAREYNGCCEVHSCTDEIDKSILLYEVWETENHHKEYVNWRKEEGVHEIISKMLRERSFSYYSFLI